MKIKDFVETFPQNTVFTIFLETKVDYSKVIANDTLFGILEEMQYLSEDMYYNMNYESLEEFYVLDKMLDCENFTFDIGKELKLYKCDVVIYEIK